MPIIDPAIALSTRQEAFCRRYAVSGNAADCARKAGQGVSGHDGKGADGRRARPAMTKHDIS